MKRLQFRHHENIFESREQALEYFSAIVNSGRTESLGFESLYAEPMVARYIEDGKTHVILAIGVDSGLTPYHLIDSADIIGKLAKNTSDIVELSASTIAKDEDLQAQITTISGTVEDNVAEIVSVEPSSANVLEEYALKNQQGVELGEHIKVYKDSSLVEVQLGYEGAFLTIDPNTGDYYKNPDGTYKLFYNDPQPTGDKQYLYLIYRCEDETLNLVGVDLNQFITENEYGEGLKKDGALISVKIDETSEPFLTVSNDGVKLSGVQEAIDTSNSASTEYTDNLVAAEREERIAADSALTSEIASALDEAKAYTTENFSAATAHINEVEATLNDKIDSANTKTDTLFAEATAYTDTKVNELSGNTDAAIAAAAQNAKNYTDGLHISKLDTPASGLTAQYKLETAEGTQLGVTVDIPKQSQITKIQVGHVGDTIDPYTGTITPGIGPGQIEIVYMRPDGLYAWATIPVSDILADYAFSSGLTTDNGVVYIDIPASERYLEATAGGLVTKNISEDLTEAIETSYQTITDETDVKINQLNSSLGGRIDYNTSAITELHREVTAITEDVRNLSEDYRQLHLEYDEVKSGITELSACVLSAVTEVREMADTVNGLVDSVSSLEDGLGELSGSVIDTAEQVETNKNDIEALSGNLNTLSGVVTGNVESINTLNGDVSDIKDRVDAIEDAIAQINSAITEIQEFIEGSGMTGMIYDTLATMLRGVENEIAVTPNSADTTITIGFDDDAIFGDQEQTAG